MTLPDALELFTYNKWANDRMLASLDPLPPEQLTRDLGNSFPTLLDTIAHIAAGEWVWLSRWKGAQPTAMPEWARSSPLADLKIRFASLEAERAVYLATLTEDALRAPLEYTLFNGTKDAQPLGVQFQHLVNHGTYHRGQVATMVRQVGAKPNPTDLIRWARER